ncbi:hypothetical protein C3F00_025050 [Pseudomonas sp. MWU13-2860]|nr:hypothetical protein C3F00_025050 [Pseudomonas sp. MWU13-2860]
MAVIPDQQVATLKLICGLYRHLKNPCIFLECLCLISAAMQHTSLGRISNNAAGVLVDAYNQSRIIRLQHVQL